MSSDADRPPDDARPSQRAGRKPPLTIDLTASPAEAGEPPVAAAKPESEPPKAAATPPPPPPPRPERPPLRPESPDAAGGGFALLGVAALAGGIVALATAYLLQFAGILPARPDPSGAQAIGLATGLKQDLTSLQAALTRDQASLAAISDRMGKLETSVTGLERRIADAGTGAPAASPAAPPSAPSGPDPELASRIDGLSSRIDEVTNRIGPIETEIAQLPQLKAEVERLGAQPGNDRAARTLALEALRAAAAKGGPFATELALYRSLAADPAKLEPLGAIATKGAPSTASLTADFGGVADAVLAATQNPSGGTWIDQLTGHAKSLVTIRPSGPIEGDTPEAILSRMRAAVDAGNLGMALEERKALPPGGIAASAAWADAAAARLDLDQKMTALLSAESTARPAQ